MKTNAYVIFHGVRVDTLVGDTLVRETRWLRRLFGRGDKTARETNRHVTSVHVSA